MPLLATGHPAVDKQGGALRHGFASRAGVTATLAAGTAWVGFGDPHRSGFFPQCFFLQTTGHWCPGCGGLRAVHDLLHGDVVGALDMNVVVTILIVPLLILGMGWWWLDGLGVKVPHLRLSTGVAWVLPALLFAFWIARNIPQLEPYLAP